MLYIGYILAMLIMTFILDRFRLYKTLGTLKRPRELARRASALSLSRLRAGGKYWESCRSAGWGVGRARPDVNVWASITKSAHTPSGYVAD